MIYSKISDTDLFMLIKSGDAGAFTEIYNRYWKILIDAAYRRLQDEEEAQEIVQELFVSLYMRRLEIQPHSSLEAFLKSALKYRVLNFFRHRVTRKRYAEIISSQPRYDEAKVHVDAEIAELTYRLKQATAKLPEKCREVFILSKIEQLSHRQIAERLGISVSTVEKHIGRGMELMRKHLGTTDAGLITVAILLSFYSMH